MNTIFSLCGCACEQEAQKDMPWEQFRRLLRLGEVEKLVSECFAARYHHNSLIVAIELAQGLRAFLKKGGCDPALQLLSLRPGVTAYYLPAERSEKLEKATVG